MKITPVLAFFTFPLFLTFSSVPNVPAPVAVQTERYTPTFRERECSSNYDGDVRTFTIYDDDDEVGNSIWLRRSSKRVKAKYFAHKQTGQSVHDRYDDWRSDKSIILMSSGAYATGWGNSGGIPTGITVDNGKIVNRKLYEDMDGLVIVEEVGGVRVSDLDAGDLSLQALGRGKRDLRSAQDRNAFLNWAVQQDATVFQTHLLIYKDELRVGDNGSGKSARRKFLLLVMDDDVLYHVVFYLKNEEYTLYDSAKGLLSYFNSKGMNVIATVNLDTGDFDIISTGGDVRDCSDHHITGTRNNLRDALTNMLVYHYE